MPNYCAARTGVDVTIKGRAVPFSFHPVARSTRRYGLQSRIFATNPWAIIQQSIEDSLGSSSRKQALAFLEQAESFYDSARGSSVNSAKPLLYYYCFLNLAKAICIQKGVRSSYEKAAHGLQEAVHPGGQEFENSFLKAFKSSPAKANIFDDLRKALGRPPLPTTGRTYELKYLAPQLLQGHRVWCEAADAQERFVEIHDISFKRSQTTKQLWLTLRFASDDLTRFGISQKRLLKESGLDGVFKRVQCREKHRGSLVLEYEQVSPIRFTGRACDKVLKAVDVIRPYVWSTVTLFPPYRKHYIYLCPPSETASMMPQVLAVYAYFYYLGSITRYRPHLFEDLTSGPFGAHIQEVIANIPQQMVYMLASEFTDREIAHAPIVA